METISSWKSFGGELSVHEHASSACACDMQFAVYTPPQAASGKVPVVWYLSGLTCNWSNVMEKSGLQRIASELGIMVIAPDTSPRGEQVANDDAYDLGQGAGFYLTATQAPWSPHFKMDQYIVEELSALVFDNFAADSARQGIMGHSMGGHGALTLHLKHPQRYQSVSALSPIVAPMQVPWGTKAFTAYLGEQQDAWADYDACKLVARQASKASILVDTGTADPFLEEQLTPQKFIDACKAAGQSLEYRMQDGYDHSYWFIATVIEDHLRHHASKLTG
ncbi:MAG: S-formylglutathione hydrolase [Granulosicoccus sp.]